MLKSRFFYVDKSFLHYTRYFIFPKNFVHCRQIV